MKTRTSIAGNKGFTLLELLVVLFVIGMVAAIVIFSAGRIRDKALFNEEARKIYLSLKHARQISILEKIPVVFRINEKQKQYRIDGGDAKNNRTHTLPQNYILIGEDLVFYPKGNSSGGLIELRNEKGQKYEIEINPVIGTPAIKRL